MVAGVTHAVLAVCPIPASPAALGPAEPLGVGAVQLGAAPGPSSGFPLEAWERVWTALEGSCSRAVFLLLEPSP